MSQSINPIAAEATRRTLTASQTERADAQMVSGERAALDEQELRDLESSELYGAPVTAAPAAPSGRLRRWFRRRA